MSDLFQAVYNWLYHDLSLRSAGLILGVLLLALHLAALVRARTFMEWARRLPRHRTAGIVLLSVDLLWSWMMVSSMDMGEFWRLRKLVLILLPVSFVLMLLYVDEFLAPRAAGILLLLAAAPVLDAAFLEPPASRLVLPVLAYGWIILGMFWVGMPYLMRDHIRWATASERRWRGLAAGGAAYSLLILALAVAFWG